MNALQIMQALRTATLAARARTGNQYIGTRAGTGVVDVVRSVPPATGRGSYAVTVLAANLTADEAVRFLGAMQ
jgi:hypothetical protein